MHQWFDEKNKKVHRDLDHLKQMEDGRTHDEESAAETRKQIMGEDSRGYRIVYSSRFQERIENPRRGEKSDREIWGETKKQTTGTSGFWVHLKDGDSGSKLHEIKMRGVKTIICKFMCQTRIEILHISNC